MKLIVAALLAAASVSAPASAAVITYSFTGTFSGSASGVGYSGQRVTFTGIGDTASARTVSDLTLVNLSSLTATDATGATVFSLTEAVSFVARPFNGAIGFVSPTVDRVYFAMTTAGTGGYNGLSATGPFTGNAYEGTTAGATFASNFGPSRIDGLTDVSFRATTAGAAVPEPATWGLMLAGFGLAGGAMRVRRRRVAFA